MTQPPSFDLLTPSTWGPALTALTAGGLGIYALIRVFRRDSRNDSQEALIDQGVQALISNLRAEVDRLNKRVESMEAELVKLHAERAMLLHKVAELEAGANQIKLI